MYAIMNTEKRVHEFERVGSGLEDGKEWDKYCNQVIISKILENDNTLLYLEQLDRK